MRKISRKNVGPKLFVIYDVCVSASKRFCRAKVLQREIMKFRDEINLKTFTLQRGIPETRCRSSSQRWNLSAEDNLCR